MRALCKLGLFARSIARLVRRLKIWRESPRALLSARVSTRAPTVDDGRDAIDVDAIDEYIFFRRVRRTCTVSVTLFSATQTGHNDSHRFTEKRLRCSPFAPVEWTSHGAKKFSATKARIQFKSLGSVTCDRVIEPRSAIEARARAKTKVKAHRVDGVSCSN